MAAETSAQRIARLKANRKVLEDNLVRLLAMLGNRSDGDAPIDRGIEQNRSEESQRVTLTQKAIERIDEQIAAEEKSGSPYRVTLPYAMKINEIGKDESEYASGES